MNTLPCEVPPSISSNAVGRHTACWMMFPQPLQVAVTPSSVLSVRTLMASTANTNLQVSLCRRSAAEMSKGFSKTQPRLHGNPEARQNVRRGFSVEERMPIDGRISTDVPSTNPAENTETRTRVRLISIKIGNNRVERRQNL